ncbi:MAG: hypothetical protein OEX07_12470 [Gammaproteobacteria bacterium]|nr:hypothetical protein [Gammaproteobacteria bacterium]
MKLPGIEITLETDKVCTYMPLAVAAGCGIIFSVAYLLEISWGYSIVFMLFIGFVASAYLSSTLLNVRDAVVEINQIDEVVFEEVDVSESLLVDLETISIEVNGLSAKQIEASRIQIEDAVTAILNRFMHLSEELTQFSEKYGLQDDEEVKKLQSGVADMLVSFQFQDRTSQILNHVANSLEMFSNEIKSTQDIRAKDGQPEYNKDEIIKKLTAGFSTAEQHAMVSDDFKHKSGNDVEFF